MLLMYMLHVESNIFTHVFLAPAYVSINYNEKQEWPIIKTDIYGRKADWQAYWLNMEQ